jgi:biopolymer transport protein ExbD
MLLFFFMVTTTMRETETMVMVNTPEATEAVKLERKDLTSYINIGTPIKKLQAQYGDGIRIQLNDSFKDVNQIRDFIAAERETKSEADRTKMTVAIKADKNARMGDITDVKQELRRCSALKIMYMAKKADRASN